MCVRRFGGLWFELSVSVLSRRFLRVCLCFLFGSFEKTPDYLDRLILRVTSFRFFHRSAFPRCLRQSGQGCQPAALLLRRSLPLAALTVARHPRFPPRIVESNRLTREFSQPRRVGGLR